MKKKAHPEYQQVLFIDSATGIKFVCGSTIKSTKTEIVDGVTHQVVDLSISSYSHPFFVGGKQIIDTEGRVDKFNKRYQTKRPAEPTLESADLAAIESPAKKKK